MSACPRVDEPVQDKLGRRAPQILAALVCLALAAVLLARLTGYNATSPVTAAVVDSRDLRFEDAAGGSVRVYDWHDGELLNTYRSGDGSFVRGILRAMTREHQQSARDTDASFRLARHSDGALTIEDLTTGRQIVLNAFGPSNAANFSALLSADAGS